MRRGIAAAALAALASSARAVETGLTVDLRGDAYARGEPSIEGWVRESLSVSAQPSSHLFVRVVWIVERDSRGEVLRTSLYRDDDRGIRRSASRFSDLLVGFRAGPATVELGKQRLTWGRASFVQPEDNLTPRDWTDPLDEVRLSPWSARLAVERGRGWGEVVVVPRYAPSRLPILGGRWLPVEPATVVNPAYPAAGPPQLRVEAAYGPDAFPPIAWRTLQAAARGGFRGPGGEIAGSFFRGYDDAPIVTAVPGAPDVARGIAPVELRRSAARLEVAGLDGEVLLGSWIVRAEGGYFHFPDGERSSFFLYEAEAQWSRGSWLAIVAWSDAIGGAPATQSRTSLDIAYLPALFLRAQYGEATDWRVALDATYGVDDRDGFVRVSGSYPFAGHVRVGAEAARFSGAPGTFFGRWRDNDRLRAFVTLSF